MYVACSNSRIDVITRSNDKLFVFFPAIVSVNRPSLAWHLLATPGHVDNCTHSLIPANTCSSNLGADTEIPDERE